MGDIDQKHMLKKDKNPGENDVKNRIVELLYQLDLSCTKVEQCAFNSINSTDQVMLGIQTVMGILQNIACQHQEICNAVEICALCLEAKEGEGLSHIVQEQTNVLTSLEIELYKVAEAALEANDAARCIEAGVVNQSEVVTELIQSHEDYII